MSLQAQPIPPIPEMTIKVAQQAFRKGNVYMQMRALLGQDFGSLQGRPATWRSEAGEAPCSRRHP